MKSSPLLYTTTSQRFRSKAHVLVVLLSQSETSQTFETRQNRSQKLFAATQGGHESRQDTHYILNVKQILLRILLHIDGDLNPVACDKHPIAILVGRKPERKDT